MDVKNAFLHEDLKEDVYIRPLLSTSTLTVCKLRHMVLNKLVVHGMRNLLLPYAKFAFLKRKYNASLFLYKT
jgi:hypothetical protein